MIGSDVPAEYLTQTIRFCSLRRHQSPEPETARWRAVLLLLKNGAAR
jgi:hypothetical protein